MSTRDYNSLNHHVGSQLTRTHPVGDVWGRKALLLALAGLFIGSVCSANPADPKSKPPSQAKKTARATSRRSGRGTTDPSTFSPDMPLGQAIDILRNSTHPPTNISVIWRDLADSAGIDRQTPIGIDGVSHVPLRVHLELLLLSLSAGSGVDIGYAVDSGVVIIATRSNLPLRRPVTRIYDVTDLLGAPATYFFPMLGFGSLGFGGAIGVPAGGLMYGGSQVGLYGSPYGYRGGYGTGTPGATRGGGLTGLINSLYGPGTPNR